MVQKREENKVISFEPNESVEPEEWDTEYKVKRLPPSFWGYFQERALKMYNELKEGRVINHGLQPIEAYSGFMRRPMESTNPGWYKELWHSFEYRRTQRKTRRPGIRKKDTRVGPTLSKIKKLSTLDSLLRISKGEDSEFSIYDERMRKIIYSYFVDGEVCTDERGTSWDYKDPKYDFLRKSFGKDTSEKTG